MGIFRKIVLPPRFCGGARLPLNSADEHLPVQLLVCRRSCSQPRSALRRLREANQSGDSTICAQTVMTDNKRAQVAIPHQNGRNLSCLAWFSSPRRVTCNTNLRRETKQRRRISHGSARAIKNMRRVRLPLVSGPDRRKRLLQGVRRKAQGVSPAGEPQASRQAGP